MAVGAKIGKRNNAADVQRLQMILQMVSELLSDELQEPPEGDDTQAAPTGPLQVNDAGVGGWITTLKAETSLLLNTPWQGELIKAAGDWTLDVLGVPFGGPNNGKDADRQYFSSRTKTYHDIYREVPAVYYHGFGPDRRPMGDPQVIGTAKYDHTDERGHWYKVFLDRTSALAKRVWDAAQKGIARASSGTVYHMARFAKDGEILNWPVAELSLLDAEGKRQPANAYAIAVPSLKALLEMTGANPPETSTPAPSAEDQHVKGQKDKMTPEELQAQEMSFKKLVAEALAADRKAREDAAAAEQARKTEIETALKAARQEWEQEKAKENRLQINGAPVVTKYGFTRKYENLDAGDLAFAAGMLTAGKAKGGEGPSSDLLKTLGVKVAGDKTMLGEEGRISLKGLGINPDDFLNGAKANELDYTTQSGFGQEFVPTIWSTSIWEIIRIAPWVIGRLPAQEFTGPGNTFTIPLESTDPTFYKIGQVTSLNATTGRPDATIGDSKLATANLSITLNKIGARVPYSGELDEDSIIPWANQLRTQTGKAAAEQIEHLLVDGDTATGATTNINHIGGTPTSTGTKQDLFLTVDGFRKLALVTNTANSYNANGTIADTTFLEVLKLMGTGGLNAMDLSAVTFLVDLNVNWKIVTLATVKTSDVFSQATIENGFLKRIWGYEVVPTGFMHWKSTVRKANTSGKVDQTTPSNNTTGAIVAVRWDQWLLGWKRHMTIKLQDIPDSDAQQLIVTARLGMINRDNEASAEAYNVLV